MIEPYRLDKSLIERFHSGLPKSQYEVNKIIKKTKNDQFEEIFEGGEKKTDDLPF